jgi:hypothetical protein
MEVCEMCIFDLVDSPRLARMVWHVQQVIPKVPIEKLKLEHFPLSVVEPLFEPSLKNLDYMKRFALAIMITHVETTQKELPAFCLDCDDVDEVLFGMVKEGAALFVEALELPDTFLPKDCKNALSKALVKWSKQTNPIQNDYRVPGHLREEAELFMKNAMSAAADYIEKDLTKHDKKMFDKVKSKMTH